VRSRTERALTVLPFLHRETNRATYEGDDEELEGTSKIPEVVFHLKIILELELLGQYHHKLSLTRSSVGENEETD
jgi:hypothetical protein